MKQTFSILWFVILAVCPLYLSAQTKFSIPACSPFAESKKFLGDRLRVPLPKGVVVKRGGDVDYSNFKIAFGRKKQRVWIYGIFGPTATSGQVPEDWISSSSEVSQRAWSFGDRAGVDAKGRLANGNYWRYIGQYGESIKYHDVPEDAANYFDKILDNLCYREWQIK